MGRYIFKRILWMVVILMAAGFVVFTLMYLVPGDTAKNLLGPDASLQALEAKRHELGIDRPYIVQLGDFLYNMFIRLDPGISWKYNTPVIDDMVERLPRTLTIGVFAMALNVLLGTVLGILAATHKGKWQDSLTMIIAMLFISAPDFWVALMFILLFSAKLGWLPAYGIDNWTCYILPIIYSSLGGIAINARQGRSTMLETIRSDFVVTARAKGQREKVIIRKHMLPNALMPIITGVAGGLAHVVAGSPIMETVFSIPGIGQYMLVGVSMGDAPIVRACVVFFSLFTSVAILIMDLCYAFLDPRIKAQYSRRKKVN
jgi:ABC-type dipeptide/oligopeptide/nickel transport system permease component